MESAESFKRINAAMAKCLRAEMERSLYLYTGFSTIERDMLKRFNRCCHPGRKIALKPRPMMMKVGKPTVRIRKYSPEIAAKIMEIGA